MVAIDLEFDELMQLDGTVNDKAQAVINAAKEIHRIQAESGIAETEAKMVQKIVTSARIELRLGFYFTNITSCPCCGKNDGYWPVRRTTKYKIKGLPDCDNPRLIRAYSLNPGFIGIKHHISLGFCVSCKDRVLPLILEALKDDQVEVDQALSGAPPRFKRHRNRKCKKCGWTGHEGGMIWAQTLMGDGKYPAYCPECKTGGIFNNDVEIADGYSIVSID